MKRTVAAVVLLSIALAGCRTPTALFSEPDRLAADVSAYPGQATIHVFRDSGRVQAMYPFSVALDKRKMGSIRRERYLVFPAAPGEHAITIACPISCSMPTHTLKFKAAAGKSYYFVFESDMAMATTIGGGLNVSMKTGIAQVDKRQAEQLIALYAPGKSDPAEAAAR